MVEFDVLIAGAGPAGCATALLLAAFAWELRVGLVIAAGNSERRTGGTAAAQINQRLARLAAHVRLRHALRAAVIATLFVTSAVRDLAGFGLFCWPSQLSPEPSSDLCRRAPIPTSRWRWHLRCDDIGDCTRDRRLGIILRRLLNRDRRLPSGEQLD